MIEALSGPGGIDIDKVLDEVSARLSHRLTGVFSPETVRRCVVESYFDLARTARIQVHVPALAENLAAERLTALAQTRGAISKPVPEVLFLCAYNAGRSQIAASLGQRHSHGRVHVRCAGSHPADWLDLTVLEALGEWDIEFEQFYPQAAHRRRPARGGRHRNHGLRRRLPGAGREEVPQLGHRRSSRTRHPDRPRHSQRNRRPRPGAPR